MGVAAVPGHFLPHAPAAKTASHFAVGHREVSHYLLLRRAILLHIATGLMPFQDRQMAIGIGRRQFISGLGGATVAELNVDPDRRRLASPDN
jgi:hypothetical protein